MPKEVGLRKQSQGNRAGNVEFVIKFISIENESLITYEVSIGLNHMNKAVVKKEILHFQRGQKGSPWKGLGFSRGEGIVAEGKLNSYEDVNLATRKRQKLDLTDILAIKELGQFKEFEIVLTFHRLIEDWYVTEFRIDAARERQEAEYSEQLSRMGDNLSSVVKYIHDNYSERFQTIIARCRRGAGSAAGRGTENTRWVYCVAVIGWKV